MNLDKLKRKHYLWFFCNCCFAIRRTTITLDLREGLVCPSCRLNSRQRAVLFAAQKTIKKGFFRELDELQSLSTEGKTFIQNLQHVWIGKIQN